MAGGGIVLALFLFGPGWMRAGPVFNLIAASSVGAIIVGTRLHRPAKLASWYFMAAGLFFFVAGDIITYNYDRLFGTELPFPSIGDVSYLAVYPCLVLGILALIRAQGAGRDRAGLIDSLMITVSAGFVSWVFLMAPQWHDAGSTLLQRLVSIAYPAMDLLLLSVIVRMAVGSRTRVPSFYLLVASALMLLVTDAVYGLSLIGSYNDQGMLEAGWGLFYLLWGAAALHPSMRVLCESAPAQEAGLTRARLVLLACTALTVQIVRTIQLVRHEPIDEPVAIVAGVALFLLMVARLAGFVHQRQSSPPARVLAPPKVGAISNPNRWASSA